MQLFSPEVPLLSRIPTPRAGASPKDIGDDTLNIPIPIPFIRSRVPTLFLAFTLPGNPIPEILGNPIPEVTDMPLDQVQGAIGFPISNTIQERLVHFGNFVQVMAT